MIGRLTAGMRAIGPVRTAFLCSLLLSAIAVWNSPVLNRDGIFYIEWAQSIADQGLNGAKLYGLLLAALPASIALVSTVMKLSPEYAAYLVNALFLAGACSLVVAIVRRRLPDAAWLACLVVLAMPGYNGYRNDVLREYGLWFFGLLALWLATRWQSSGRWHEAVACQLAVLCAALFRTEALIYFPALMLWQALAAAVGTRVKNIIAIGFLPMAFVVLALILLSSGMVEMPDRLAHVLKAFDPLGKWRSFNEMADRMSDLLFGHKYTREEAAYVLFFGLLTIIPVKFLKMSGVLVVPMVFAFSGRSLRAVLARWQPLPWVFLAHALALAAYVTYQFFLQGRYVAMLHLLAVPVVVEGLFALMQRYPRWRGLMVALALLTLLANVVSLSPKSTQIAEAGKWLTANVKDPSRVYVDNPRVGFYGGLGYVDSGRLRKEIPTVAEAAALNRFDLFVLDVPRKDREVENWLAANRFQVVQRFANRAGDAVIVAIPADAQPSPATIERNRANIGPTE